MFTVIACRSGIKYVVYSVREKEEVIEFLLYKGKWIWAAADNFHPVNDSSSMGEVEEKYKAW